METAFPLDNCRDCIHRDSCSIREYLNDTMKMVPDVDISGSSCEVYKEDDSYIPDDWKKIHMEPSPPEDLEENMKKLEALEDLHTYMNSMYYEFMDYSDDSEASGDIYMDFVVIDVPQMKEGLDEYVNRLLQKGYVPSVIIMNHNTMNLFTDIETDKTLVEVSTTEADMDVLELDTIPDNAFRIYSIPMDDMS